LHQPYRLLQYLASEYPVWSAGLFTLWMIALTIPLAAISYYLVERPVLRSKPRLLRESTDRRHAAGAGYDAKHSAGMLSLARMLEWLNSRRLWPR
jgi:peptidoglycan/LPS O-acetylase OafA/YrhL